MVVESDSIESRSEDRNVGVAKMKPKDQNRMERNKEVNAFEVSVTL
jgi:hypothetical protein